MKISASPQIRTLCAALIASSLVFCSAATHAHDVFRVSVGSYANLENARKALATANAALGDGFKVFRANPTAKTVYRILSQPYETHAQAAQLVAAVNRADITDAWIIVSPARTDRQHQSKVNLTIYGISSR